MARPSTQHRNRLIRGLHHDCRGMAAVEFALIVPFMIFLFFGAVETNQRIAVSQKVELIAHAMADLAAQKLTGGDAVGQAALTDSDLGEIFTAAEMLIYPLPGDAIDVEIDQIRLIPDPKGKTLTARLDWAVLHGTEVSRKCGVLKPSTKSDYDQIPDKFINVTDKSEAWLISARVGIKYKPAHMWKFFSREQDFSQWAYASPRNTYSPNAIQMKSTWGKRQKVICELPS